MQTAHNLHEQNKYRVSTARPKFSLFDIYICLFQSVLISNIIVPKLYVSEIIITLEFQA